MAFDFAQQPHTYFWECWSLVSERGRQRWHFELPQALKGIVRSREDWQHPQAQAFLHYLDRAFVFDKRPNPNSADKVFRYLRSRQLARPPADWLSSKASLNEQVEAALLNGFAYYETLQEEDGNWVGDYGGPLFLLVGLVIAAHVTDTPFEVPLQVLIKRYLWNHQNEDSGWGLHIEGESTLFGTVLSYVALRLLGESPSHPQLTTARQWILDRGGATHIPPWGKFYLSLLRLYAWEGNDALLPELWKLPKWVPIHPGKYWCHNRMIFLPMSYCFGHRITAADADVIQALRTELYPVPYSRIRWRKARRQAAETDVFHPVSPWYRLLSRIVNAYEATHSKRLRRKALHYVRNYIDHEDAQTAFIDIGPVSQALNSICVWHHHGRDSDAFQKHVQRWQDYLWIAEDGAKMGGYNGSQLWDTAFVAQTLTTAKMEGQFPQMTQRIHRFIELTQIKVDPLNHRDYWREPTVGTWPFSTVEHAWAVTDCTAEGVKVALLLEEKSPLPKEHAIDLERLKPAVDWLLAMQNKDGGWATYEKKRAPRWIEVLNPSLLFENIMTEVTYTECSSATMQGLKAFSERYDYRRSAIATAVKRGYRFIERQQRRDGSWYGCWGICFTYGTWFGIEGLICGGAADYSGQRPAKRIVEACDFLVRKQNADGSWGEAFASCVQHQYIPHQEGQLINTAWALLGLMKAAYPQSSVVEKGIQFILARQEENGDFPQEGISGVFNGNCMETYTSYRNVFPLWALGRYYRDYLPHHPPSSLPK